MNAFIVVLLAAVSAGICAAATVMLKTLYAVCMRDIAEGGRDERLLKRKNRTKSVAAKIAKRAAGALVYIVLLAMCIPVVQSATFLICGRLVCNYMPLNVVSDSRDSLLAMIGSFISPIFAPLGFDDWRISTALITGFTAKESVVSTLTILLGGTTEALRTLFTLPGAFTFLVFSLLYTPCVAAISAVKGEVGGLQAFFVVVFQCVTAWVVAFVVHTLLLLVL